jgi:hypothetical protein
MRYETFLSITLHLQKAWTLSSAAYAIGIDTTEFTEPENHVIYTLLKEVMTEEALDDCSWFMYEKGYIEGKLNPDMKSWDKDGNEILRTFDELYEHIVKIGGFKTITK